MAHSAFSDASVGHLERADNEALAVPSTMLCRGPILVLSTRVHSQFVRRWALKGGTTGVSLACAADRPIGWTSATGTMSRGQGRLSGGHHRLWDAGWPRSPPTRGRRLAEDAQSTLRVTWAEKLPVGACFNVAVIELVAQKQLVHTLHRSALHR